jgi:hypothetical protein
MTDRDQRATEVLRRMDRETAQYGRGSVVPEVEILRVQKGTHVVIRFVSDMADAVIIDGHRTKNKNWFVCGHYFGSHCDLHEEDNGDPRRIQAHFCFTVWDVNAKSLRVLRGAPTRYGALTELKAIYEQRGTLLGYDVDLANQPELLDRKTKKGKFVERKRYVWTALNSVTAMPKDLVPFPEDKVRRSLRDYCKARANQSVLPPVSIDGEPDDPNAEAKLEKHLDPGHGPYVVRPSHGKKKEKR